MNYYNAITPRNLNDMYRLWTKIMGPEEFVQVQLQIHSIHFSLSKRQEPCHLYNVWQLAKQTNNKDCTEFIHVRNV